MSARYIYAYGWRTRSAAEEGLRDMFAAGEVGSLEAPAVVSYRANSGAKRWGVEVNA